jgi:hypothetical protein
LGVIATEGYVARSILITGNGIGLALDPDFFSLQNGLESVWKNTEHLSNEHKDLILSAIEGTTDELPPSSEDQLDKLQVAIVATQFLSDFEVSGTPWISEPAKELPSTFRKYIYDLIRPPIII